MNATRDNGPHIVTIYNDTRRVVVNRRRLCRTYIPTHASYRRIRAACDKFGRMGITGVVFTIYEIRK